VALTEWRVPPGAQPRPSDYGYDLERALASVVGLSAIIPDDAFTAETLGTERAGNAVVIDPSGILVTIGYLVTEAQSVWLATHDGRVVPGHVTGIDGESGLALIQALGRLDLPALPLGSSAGVRAGARVVVGGAGGRQRSVAAQVTGRQEFAGYWEYLLDDAIFTAPSHPHWGGTALIGSGGDLLGIGSLQLQQERGSEGVQNLNMVVPIDLLKPIMEDLLIIGRPNRPARPWLGVFATEIEGRVVVAGLAGRGPASDAGLQSGDVIASVAGRSISDLAGFYRTLWSLGPAGVEAPLAISRGARSVDVRITTVDRNSLLKRRVVH
jgi:S1-C subfamily serine protease